MKQYGNVLFLTIAGFMVSGLCAMDAQPRKSRKKSEPILTSGKVLGALGLAGAGASAYYYLDPAGAKAKFDTAQQKFGELKTAVTDYYAQADARTIGYGILGTAVVGYICYKCLIQEEEPELAIDAPDSDAFMKTLGASRKPAAAVKKSTPSAQHFEGWLNQTGALFMEVFSSIKDEGKRRSTITPYIKIATKDPHQLLRYDDLIERMTLDQKLQLMHIFVEYTLDRVLKMAHTLLDSLTDKQEGVREMLAEALEAGDVSTVLGLLELLVADNHISGKQAEFVEGEITIIKDCGEIQANFSHIYNLDQKWAEKLQREADAHSKKSAPRNPGNTRSK